MDDRDKERLATWKEGTRVVEYLKTNGRGTIVAPLKTHLENGHFEHLDRIAVKFDHDGQVLHIPSFLLVSEEVFDSMPTSYWWRRY